MKINNIILILAITATGLSCQSIKDGLSGNKSENSDEFLVEKKNPLVLPPKYLTLPKPKNKENDQEILQTEVNSLEQLFRLDNETVISTSEKSSTAENFVLKNIK
tara:strand:+ start:316 stop:630 length:315 start_codon:yes stop_codon:yes gene_type:complete